MRNGRGDNLQKVDANKAGADIGVGKKVESEIVSEGMEESKIEAGQEAEKLELLPEKQLENDEENKNQQLIQMIRGKSIEDPETKEFQRSKSRVVLVGLLKCYFDFYFLDML